MKKIYALVVMSLMMLLSISSTAHAAVATETLTSNVDKVVAQFEGFVVYHYYNFKTMSRDGGETGTFTIGTEAVNGYNNAPMAPITTEGFENIQLGIGRGSITTPDLRWRDANYGFYEFGSGARNFRVTDLRANMIVVIQGAQGQSYDYLATGVLNAEAAEEITEEIHNNQIAAAEAAGEEGKADEYRYFRILQDGPFDFSVNRGCYLLSMAILIDGGASEAVSSPTLKLAGVDGSARLLEFKPGESTFGNECTTWYGIVEAGEQALYLIDSDEVDHIEYVYELDEEGKQVLDGEGNPIVLEEITVYKKVLDPEAAESGNYGDQQFNPEDGSITVSSNDDEDGDGYVTVEAATVSSSGVYSDIVTLKVAVGEITLNAPAFTLVGLNGTMRQYQVGWTNNTLCGEPFTVTVSGDDEEFYEEGVALGTVFEVASNIKATVHVEGYTDGENELTEVLEPGVNFYRKNKEKAEAGEHDWDFVLQDEATKTLIKGAKVDYCYLESDPDTHYTAEEYEAGSSADGNVDLSDATPVYVNSGWTWDGGRNRATMNVAQYSETVDDETTWYALEEGIDKNGNGFGYDPNAWNPFVDGLLVSCPPNANNASTILQYIDKADGDGSDGIGYLGIYFMSRPTLTFERPAAQYGEYVLIYQGAGGSNYTTSRWPSLHQVPADDELHVTLNSGGIHVFYIDVYTNDAVPALEEDEVYVGINGVEASDKAGVVYTLDGRRVNRNGLQKGLYIINGKKVLVK